ncbi:MAG TPA: NAD(P)-binding domain-containing protein [Candidatus Yaniella excrementigallinarum]|nr:NAD(P)-binding domain-containing protein [Candidatus Yaniella excrementigallinarum]
MPSFNRIGILGAGRAGTAIARSAARSGIEVQIASTRSPRQMHYHLLQYAPSASGVYAEDIAEGVKLIVLAVPQEDLDDVDPIWVDNKILIDATNRWDNEPLPAWLQTRLNSGLSSSEALAEHFRSAEVVKALNHISHWAMDAPRTQQLPAAGIASNDAVAAQKVADFVAALGFDPVIANSLASGCHLEPGTTFFNVAATADQLKKQLQKSD